MVTVPKLVLAGVAVLLGRPYPPAALILLLPFGPWQFDMGFATVDLNWLLPRDNVKILPLVPASPFIMWYAYLSRRGWPGCGRRSRRSG